jgi:beta-1,4-mannosyl-glycoprotein beta-1,4-N-acetylglucosaminyltransferase
MKIIDCFIFYNEIDMLLYRLDVLYEYVDFFILVEALYTHSGKEKQLYYDDNIDLFKKYNSKIIHVVLTDFPFKYPNIDYTKNQQWINEHFQRNAIKVGIDKLQLNKSDILLISDLDEIPDPEILVEVLNGNLIINNMYSLEQDFYYYNLNTKMGNNWDASKILSVDKFLSLNMSCQDLRHTNCMKIKKAGWHLSYFGDKYFIQNKIQHFGHQEFNNSNFNELDIIENRINNQLDLYSRNNEQIVKISIKDNTYLPPQCDTKLSKFILY